MARNQNFGKDVYDWNVEIPNPNADPNAANIEITAVNILAGMNQDTDEQRIVAEATRILSMRVIDPNDAGKHLLMSTTISDSITTIANYRDRLEGALIIQSRGSYIFRFWSYYETTQGRFKHVVTAHKNN
jgi:hypothetical protein